MSMKYLMRCQRGDIVSRRGEVFKINSIYCGAMLPGYPGNIDVHVSTLFETDVWVLEKYPRKYSSNQEVRLLGHEE